MKSNIARPDFCLLIAEHPWYISNEIHHHGANPFGNGGVEQPACIADPYRVFVQLQIGQMIEADRDELNQSQSASPQSPWAACASRESVCLAIILRETRARYYRAAKAYDER